MKVYIAQCEETGLVKIGVSRHPEKRVQTLTNATGNKISLVAYMEGDYQTEHRLKKKYEKCRVLYSSESSVCCINGCANTEWFDPDIPPFRQDMMLLLNAMRTGRIVVAENTPETA